MKTLDALLPANAGERRTLADIIFSKLESFEAGKTTTVVHEGQGGMSDFFPRGAASRTDCAGYLDRQIGTPLLIQQQA